MLRRILLGQAVMVLVVAAIRSTQATLTVQPRPISLKDTILSMKAPNVAWRKIQWKSCLLEGLKESREKKKPLILWVFIDRPADDARC